MLNQLKKIYVVSFVAMVGVLFLPTSAIAADPLGAACGAGGPSAVCQARGDNVNTMIENITNTMLFLLGAVAVVAIIVGGFMYATAAGDPGKVKNAKNTVLYAVIGLIVALLAWAIVRFTVTRVAGP